MKNKFRLFLFISIMSIISSYGQEEQPIFDFDIFNKSEDTYEIALRINITEVPDRLQLIFFEEGHIVNEKEVTIIKSQHEGFQLLFDGIKEQIFLHDFNVEVKKIRIKAKPKSKSIEIKVLDNNLNVLATKTQQIR